MSTTQIKRLFQSNTEFVPITLAEAVVVNATDITGLGSLGITTLDRVLRTTMGVVGTNAASIKTLLDTVSTINTTLASKLDKLTAGTGINISEAGVISVTTSLLLYKIVSNLPINPSATYENTIYLVPSGSVVGNIFQEFLCVNKDGVYSWEKIGEVQTDVDLSGYVTLETFNLEISTINTKLAATITALNVTTSDGTSKVVVNYTIPSDLYDSAVDTDTTDLIIGL